MELEQLAKEAEDIVAMEEDFAERVVNEARELRAAADERQKEAERIAERKVEDLKRAEEYAQNLHSMVRERHKHGQRRTWTAPVYRRMRSYLDIYPMHKSYEMCMYEN